MKWSACAAGVEWDLLYPHQKVNKFEGLHRCLTTKSGLLRSMSECHCNLPLLVGAHLLLVTVVTSEVNQHHFVPRAYDLCVLRAAGEAEFRSVQVLF